VAALKPGKTLNDTQVQGVMTFESAISKVASLAKPLTDIIGGLILVHLRICVLRMLLLQLRNSTSRLLQALSFHRI
jgi:hypothetical protein